MPPSIAATHAASLKQQHRTRQVLAFWMLAVATAAFLSVLMTASAYGQAAKPAFEVKKWNPDWFTDKELVRKIKTAKGEIINDAAALSKYRDFFVNVYRNTFASMTDPKEIENLQARKDEVLKDIYNAAKRENTSVARGLSVISFQECEAIAKGNYYPPAQITAVLMMGELNDREPNSLERRPPIAMKAVFPVLLEIVKDEKYNDGMRVAALQGLQRHAGLNGDTLPAPQQDQFADLLISVASAAPPADRDPEAHGWIQTMAIRTLLTLKNERRAEQVAKLVMEIPTKPDASQTVLVYAARTTPKLVMPKDFKPATDAVLKRWANQMIASIGREAHRIENFEKPRPVASAMGSGMGMEMGMGVAPGMEMGSGMEMGYGMGMGMGPAGAAKPQTIEITLARRMLNDILESFHLGLTGTRDVVDAAQIKSGLIKNLSDGPEKTQALKLVTIMDEVKTGVNDTTIDKNLPYAEKLREMEQKLLAFVDPNAAAKPKPSAIGPGFSPFNDAGSPAAVPQPAAPEDGEQVNALEPGEINPVARNLGR
ncbi:MAG: hypothetical protein R3C05_31840 [Pirellulaceae bacterium]